MALEFNVPYALQEITDSSYLSLSLDDRGKLYQDYVTNIKDYLFFEHNQFEIGGFSRKHS